MDVVAIKARAQDARDAGIPRGQSGAAEEFRRGGEAQASAAAAGRERELTIGQARSIIGSLGFPTKMPGTSYGLPATACIAGAKLGRVAGTVCSMCYALGGNAKYQMPRAAVGQRKRLAAIKHPRWADAMVMMLTRVHAKGRIWVDLGSVGVRLARKGGSRFRWNDAGFHRWHDSGDIQGEWHLDLICDVAARTPEIRHWLPTQELGMVRRYLVAGGSIPDNLVVRVSSVMIDDPHTRAWPHTSSVSACVPAGQGHHACPAPRQANTCGTCRACWSAQVAHVVYELH